MTDAVQIALIGGLATAIPILVGQWRQSVVAGRKLAEVKEGAEKNAAAAVEVASKAAESTGKVIEVAGVIHTLVNQRLSDERAAREKAEALNARLFALLESSGVKMPPDLSPSEPKG